MALWTYAFVTLAEAKARLRLNAGDASQDSAIEDLISTACQLVEKRRESFVLQRLGHVEFFDGRGLSHLLLEHWPAVVTSIHDSADRSWDAESLVAAEDYVVDEEEGEVALLDGAFGNGRRNVRVVYDAGFSAANVPHALKGAAILTAQRQYDLFGFGGGRLGNRSISTPNGGTVSLDDEQIVPPQAMQIIREYQRRSL